MKKLRNVKALLCFVLALLLSVSGALGTALAAEPIDIMMGTSGLGLSWYPVGVGLAAIWNEKLAEDGINVFVQATGGGAENVQMLYTRELNMCTLGALAISEAYHGLGGVEKLDDVSVMCSFQVTSMQPIILKEYVKTGTFADVDGLKFGVGTPGGNAEKMFNVMNEAFGGLSVTAERLGAAQATDGLKNGTLHGNFFTGGAPFSSVIDLMATPGLEVQLLSVSEEDVAKMNEVSVAHQFGNMWSYAELPAGTYEGMDKPVGVAQAYDMFLVKDDVPEDIVYKLLDQMFQNIDQVKAINQSMSVFTMDGALIGIPIKMHPGAIKYFQEKGYTIPSN